MKHLFPPSLVAFLLVASFGILFAGCNGPEDTAGNQDFVFTQESLDAAHQLTSEAERVAGSGSQKPYLEPLATGSGSKESTTVVLDLSNVSAYKSIRTAQGSAGSNVYQVNNEFVNVRAKPSIKAAFVTRLNFGEAVQVVEFTNGQWAKVKLANGQDGYAVLQYLARLTSDEKMAGELRAFEGQYFVHYGFVNMRKEANQKSEKLTEIPGNTILKPLTIKDGWAKVSFNGKEGYVATGYLSPFHPTFLVRQDQFTLPVLDYHMVKGQEKEILQGLVTHTDRLRQGGKSLMNLRQFYDVLLSQQRHDTRLEKKGVVVAITGVTAENAKTISDVLSQNRIPATLFVETNQVSLRGITEKMLLTLQANGFDIESAGHTGDDLRGLTDSQVTLELEQSRKILEDYLKKPVFAISYPVRGTNDRVMALAAEAGYLLGIGGGTDTTFSRDQLLNMPSFAVFPSMSSDEVLKLVSP